MKYKKFFFVFFLFVSFVAVFADTKTDKTVFVKEILIREKIVQTAQSLIGQDYWPGGTGSSDDYGFDCSGLTQYCYMKAGIAIPKKSVNQFKASVPVKYEMIKKGDLVFFNTLGLGPTHVGIYEGNGYFIHAPGIGKVITRAKISSGYWQARYFGAGTFIIINNKGEK